MNHTLSTYDPAEYNTKLNLINNTILNMHRHPKMLSLTLDPKFTHKKYISNMAAKASKLLKFFSSTSGANIGRHCSQHAKP